MVCFLMLFSTDHHKLTVYGLSLAFSLSSYAQSNTPGRITGNEFNPAISFIIDARYTEIDDDELDRGSAVILEKFAKMMVTY